MQLRHIRPGSLDWQDAQTDEVDQGYERLTPEEVVRLRSQSDDKGIVSKKGQRPVTEVQ